MTQAAEARLTDEMKKQREADDAKRVAEAARLKRDFQETFSTASGMHVLRTLMEWCGYQRPSVVADARSGEIVPLSTVYNEARRNLYLKIRELVSRDVLIPVECKGLESDNVDIFS